MTKHIREQISYEDVERHFNLPVLEAAARLGVSNVTLKRVCRENGVSRWPYRKLMAGKTLDEIKRDAALLNLQNDVTPSSSSKSQSPGMSSADGLTPSPSVSLAYNSEQAGDASALVPAPVLPLAIGSQGVVSCDKPGSSNRAAEIVLAKGNHNGFMGGRTKSSTSPGTFGHRDGLYEGNNKCGNGHIAGNKQLLQQEQTTAVPWLRRNYIN